MTVEEGEPSEGEEEMVEKTVEDTDEYTDDPLKRYSQKAEKVMNYFQLLAAYILLILFAIGVLDLGLKLYSMTTTGQIFQTANVIGLLETALLLFLIVEVFRTSVAHLEGLAVLPLVIDVAIIGVARSLITYRIESFETEFQALLAGASYAIILFALIASFFIVHRQKRRKLESHK